ncbi:hypothetical protein CTA2_5198 [Colletotrichum tanaceti]|nr:hypothetical protein CTA2_5198 [Colletotrichum tanaceti]
MHEDVLLARADDVVLEGAVVGGLLPGELGGQAAGDVGLGNNLGEADHLLPRGQSGVLLREAVGFLVGSLEDCVEVAVFLLGLIGLYGLQVGALSHEPKLGPVEVGKGDLLLLARILWVVDRDNLRRGILSLGGGGLGQYHGRARGVCRNGRSGSGHVILVQPLVKDLDHLFNYRRGRWCRGTVELLCCIVGGEPGRRSWHWGHRGVHVPGAAIELLCGG